MNGWNPLHIAKADFSPSDSPSWAAINGAANTVKSDLLQTASVTFDDLRLVANKRIVETLEYDELSRLKAKTDAMGIPTSSALASYKDHRRDGYYR